MSHSASSGLPVSAGVSLQELPAVIINIIVDNTIKRFIGYIILVNFAKLKLLYIMQLFYAPDIVPPYHILPEEESRHCVRVLRMQPETSFI